MAAEEGHTTLRKGAELEPTVVDRDQNVSWPSHEAFAHTRAPGLVTSLILDVRLGRRRSSGVRHTKRGMNRQHRAREKYVKILVFDGRPLAVGRKRLKSRVAAFLKGCAIGLDRCNELLFGRPIACCPGLRRLPVVGLPHEQLQRENVFGS